MTFFCLGLRETSSPVAPHQLIHLRLNQTPKPFRTQSRAMAGGGRCCTSSFACWGGLGRGEPQMNLLGAGNRQLQWQEHADFWVGLFKT